MRRRGGRWAAGGRAPWYLALGCLALALCAAAGCGGPRDEASTAPDWLVIGIDGADWGVVNALWGEGKLPHLRALAERGVAGRLGTSYGASPVIWTTVATGVAPEVHGITGFAVPTPAGDVPVSSRLRKVPALWNMLTTAGRRVAVVSWWASWPAEPVAGVVISDRALMPVEQGVSPPELAASFAEWESLARREPNLFDPRLTTQKRDHVTQFAARQLLDVEFDLVLVYFRGVDIASHRYWKYWEPERFRDVDPAELAELRHMVPSTYEATDAAIGRLVEKAGPAANVMVLSDHGFHAEKREEIRIMLDFDDVLRRLGFQARGDDGIDWERTELYTFATAKFRLNKRVRYADRIAAAERPALRERFTREIEGVTWAGGEPAFRVRDPGDRERRTGADFIVDVLPRGASRDLRHGESVWRRAVGEITVLSGTHGQSTDGLLFAAGPDVDPEAAIDGIHIHDIAPTLLYGLGLPVGEDFVGRAWQELFRATYRQRRPLRSVATWGTMGDVEAVASAADAEILDDLRALGYID